MDPERLRLIDQIFNDALELPRSERCAFIAQQCGDDEVLRAQVDEMMELADEADESPIFEKPVVHFELDWKLSQGDSIGPYRIVKQLGEGGMGQVYLAQQVEPFEREVAIKVIRAGSHNEHVVSRFRREQETLARLSHPYIAQVYDAGFTGAKNPYFVMEYIDGKPINVFCEEHNLSIKERLHLFMQFCEALQHAHQRGIIHRDLKPANMLVGFKEDKPVPKIIDFGIAKLVGVNETIQLSSQLEGQIGSNLTLTGALVGSLGFMSPEQTSLRSSDVDTRSDIYAMGVVLYELLCGRRPFDECLSQEMGYKEALRIIQQETILPPGERLTNSDLVSPSCGLSPTRLRRTLKGDLAAITMKALARNKDDRYDSPRELARDIENYLHNLPVQARPHTRIYLFRRIIKRNKILFATGTTTFLALIVAVVFSVTHLIRYQQANEKSLQTLTILEDFLSSPDPTKKGKDIKVVELLSQFPKTIKEDTRPDVLGNVYEILGKTYFSLGDLDGALNLHQKALAAREEAYGREHPDYFKSQHYLARTYLYLSENARAEEMCRQLIPKLQKSLGPTHPTTLAAITTYSDLLNSVNRGEEALALMTKTLQQVPADDAEDESVIGLKHNLAVLYGNMGRSQESRRILQEVINFWSRTRGDDHPKTLFSRYDLAKEFYSGREYDAAMAIVDQILPVMSTVLGDGHLMTIRATSFKGAVLYGLVRLDEAETYFNRALTHSRDSLGEGHRETLNITGYMASLYNEMGREEETLKLLKQVADSLAEIYGRTDPETLEARYRYGYKLIATNPQQAIPVLQDTLGEARTTFKESNNALVLKVMGELVKALTLVGEYEQAQALAREYLSLTPKNAPANQERIAVMEAYLARNLAQLGEQEQALHLFEKFFQEHVKLWARDSQWLKDVIAWRVQALEDAGRHQEAEQFKATYSRMETD